MAFPVEELRSEYPALAQAGDFLFFDNAAGAQVPSCALAAITDHLIARNVQRGGPYGRSQEVDAMIAYAKGSPPADPDKPVLVAGEPERIKRAAMIEDGIDIEENTWEALMAAGESVGLSRQKMAEIQDEG